MPPYKQQEQAQAHARSKYIKNGPHIRAKSKAWYEAHRERGRATRRAYYAANRERLLARNKAWGLAHRTPEKNRIDHLRNMYGMTQEQFEEMNKAQNGQCAICGRAPILLHVDHVAGTRTIRGLLCGPCNRAIGMLQHDATVADAAAIYLRKHQEK